MEKRILEGEIISSGVGVGILCFVDFRPDPGAYSKTIGHRDIAKEISRFDKEVDSVINELRESIEILRADSLSEEADIIQAHIAILEDDIGFRGRVHEKIKANRLAAEIALEHVLQEITALLESSENMLFAQRAADFRDVEMRLKRKLNREDSVIFSELLRDIEEPIVAVRELLPSLVLESRSKGVCGFIVEQGTSLSHAAILAKSFGLPVLRIEGFHSLGIGDKEPALVDAVRGMMLIGPDEEDIDCAIMPVQETHTAEHKTDLPAKLWLNVFDELQIEEDDLVGIEGVGLYRTEFLFMQSRGGFPTEDEQFTIYSSLLRKCRDVPVTIRTLDVGGDKGLPYFSFGPQENPYLGLRAHRIYRFHPEIFITQIRAMLRAGIDVDNLRILYPMIETLDDLFFIQGLLAEAIQSLESDGMEYRSDFQEGVLLEVPSAVWNVKELLNCVDFASVGTNDLFQYLFAVDRNNANVREAYKPESPVALRVLEQIVNTARELNKSVSICGEIASDICFVPVLVGLGFENLSIELQTVPTVRRYLSSLAVSKCKELVAECLGAKRTEEVKAALDRFNSVSREPDLSNLQSSSEFIDPICKMVVNRSDNRWIATRDGNEFHFCCKGCRDRFMEIEAYVKQP